MAGRDLVAGREVMSVGLDLTEISDVALSLDRFGERFRQRIFSPRELAEWDLVGNPASMLAVLFAAKEATIKALRVEGSQPAWTSMELLSGAGQQPCRMRLSGAAAEMASNRLIDDLYVYANCDERRAAVTVIGTRQCLSLEAG